VAWKIRTHEIPGTDVWGCQSYGSFSKHLAAQTSVSQFSRWATQGRKLGFSQCTTSAFYTCSNWSYSGSVGLINIFSNFKSFQN